MCPQYLSVNTAQNAHLTPVFETSEDGLGIPTYFRNAVFYFCLFGIVHWSRTYTQYLTDNDINYRPTTLQNRKLLFRFCLVDSVFKYVPNKGSALMKAIFYVTYMLGLLCIGFSSGSLKGKDHLESLGTNGLINLEMVFTRSKVDGCGLGLAGSG